MTENKLKACLIFKHTIQAHIQALKHTCKTVCCIKALDMINKRDMTKIFAFHF